MSYETYKLIHLLSVIFLFLSLGGYLMLSSNKTLVSRKLIAITHGISVIVILVAGFGLLARLGFSSFQSWPLWVWVKLVIWLILAVIIILIRRMPELRISLWFIIPILGGIAAYMAIFKILL
ncbi:MAG TPA: SirB2 family protein [Thermodesulfobacteriota bacterium]